MIPGPSDGVADRAARDSGSLATGDTASRPAGTETFTNEKASPSDLPARMSGAMPAEAIHLTALREALASPRIDPALRRLVERESSAARLGAVVVDLPYFQRFPEQVARYAVGLPPAHSPWGVALHECGPIEALVALLVLARRRRDDAVAAFAVGLASHAFLDRALHPLINALGRANGVRRGKTSMSAHMEVEKFQSIIFHERYHGRDYMGTPTLARFIAVPLAPRLATHPIGRALRSALAGSFGAGPSVAELRDWGRGYDHYTALIGSPLGKTIAPESAKERARPIFLAGPWGTFDGLLAEAIRGSIDVMEAAFSVTIAGDGAAESAALERFRELLGPGTIDAAGDDVDLEKPYLIASHVDLAVR